MRENQQHSSDSERRTGPQPSEAPGLGIFIIKRVCVMIHNTNKCLNSFDVWKPLKIEQLEI